MVYAIYLNEEKDEQGRNIGYFGYEDGHKLKRVYVGVCATANDHEILGNIFEKFNIGHPSDYKARSLSVGDVIVLHDLDTLTMYACESVGWKKLFCAQAAGIGLNLTDEERLQLDTRVQATLSSKSVDWVDNINW